MVVISEEDSFVGVGLDGGTEGVFYDESLLLTGTTLCSGSGCSLYIDELPPPGEYVLAAGVLPEGLSIVGSNLVGTPATGSSGSYSFVVCCAEGCKQYFLVINKALPVDKYTFGQVMSVLRMLNRSNVPARRYGWPTTGTRYARPGAPTDIKWIGLRPSNSPAWDSMANSMVLWGYNYNPAGAVPATGAVARPLKAEDIGYADLSATDWVISGSGVPASSTLDAKKMLRTWSVVNHKLSGPRGVYIASWPTGGDVLVDLDGRNLVDIKSVTVGDLAIAPGFQGNLSVSMVSYLNGSRRNTGNLCSLHLKFFESHNSPGVELYRSGGGEGWDEVLEFGAPEEVPNDAVRPVGGAYCIYKLVRGPIGAARVLSVSLRIRLEGYNG